MKNFKIIAPILLLLMILLELFVFNTKKSKDSVEPTVAVSTFALYDIVKHISPQSVRVVNMLPFGTDPHSFELTPRLMADIEKSSLVLYSGAGLEPWIEKMTFKNRAIDMSSYVKLRKLGDGELQGHHHEHKHTQRSLDPHYWLDFENMQKLAFVVSAELTKLQPLHKELYKSNRDKYLRMLQSLDEQYKKSLHKCKLDTVMLNHNSIGYLAKKYNFHVESLSGLSPEADPTPSDIKRVLQEVKKDNIHTVFYEKFVNSKVMQSISKDSDVAIEVIQPLGNITADEAKSNASYEKLMLQNLKKLSKALECH